MNGLSAFPWQHQQYAPQSVQSGQGQPQHPLGPAQVSHSQLLQQALMQPQQAPQTAPELGLDMVAQALNADTQRQQQSAANTANAQLPQLNSALGDLGISPVQPWSAGDTGLRRGGLGGLAALGSRAFSSWGK